MASSLLSQTPAQNFITDPTQIKSKEKFNIQPFTVEKLYMTRTVGGSSWSPDGKQVAFITNISGRNNLWTVAAESGWPISRPRSAASRDPHCTRYSNGRRASSS